MNVTGLTAVAIVGGLVFLYGVGVAAGLILALALIVAVG